VAEVGWPESLWFVRHGESVGNVANDAARKAKALRLDIDVNDSTVELTDVGSEQAIAFGKWSGDQPRDRLPTHVAVSPYARARETARLILETSGLETLPLTVDERLRDREQGVLDRMTGAGLRSQFPDEAARRDYVGKFWYRPSGGESWADVATRMRAWLLEVRLVMTGERVLVVTHDVPILVARYILENLTADAAASYSGQLRNCSLTSFRARPDASGMELEAFNDTTAVQVDDAPVTAHD
jgi:2,3-bisphosphoglycerate-dependent phosphoglycerate mutase